MNFAYLISQQLRHPRGWLGAWVATLMNRKNAGINELTFHHLQIEPGHQVMEIGFGGGGLLEQFIASAGHGNVTGVEMSQTLLDRARRNPLLRSAILREGVIESLPFADGSFDRVCTVNTIYFWNDPSQALREVLRVLKPGGRFTIGFHTEADLRRTGVSNRIFRFYDADDVEALLAEMGFGGISRVCGVSGDREFICISAHHSSPLPKSVNQPNPKLS